MKNLLRAIGGLLIFVSLIFFLYGSIKTVEGEKEKDIEINLGDDITMVEKNQSEQFAEISFKLALFCFLGGGIVFLFSRGTKNK